MNSEFSKWTVDEFRERYRAHITENGHNLESLNTFFSYCFPVLPDFPQELYNENVQEGINWGNAEEKLVQVNKLRGKSWVFKNDNIDGKPYIESLASIFLTDNPNDLPAIPVIKLPDNLYAAGFEGNHRIYAAYLRGWRIKIIYGEL